MNTKEPGTLNLLTNPNKNTTFNFSIAIKTTGITSEHAKKAIFKLLDVHSGLKARLIKKDNQVVMLRRDNWYPTIDVIILNEEPNGEFFKRLIKHFDVLNEDLFRATLFIYKNDVFTFMDFHHTVSDGVSNSILVADYFKLLVGKHVEEEKMDGYELGLVQKERLNEAYYELIQSILYDITNTRYELEFVLTEEIKDYDRDTIRNIPKLVEMIGFEIRKR